jgi:hypothetical protein
MSDEETVTSLCGIHVGMLTREEKEAFENCCKSGFAFREYKSDCAYLMGIASVGVRAAGEGKG